MQKTPASSNQTVAAPVDNEGINSNTSKRGFASMAPEKRKEISAAGGKAAHSKGRAHKFNPAKAAEAGRKGGLSISTNREHMAAIGKKGGDSRSKKAGLSNRYDDMIEQYNTKPDHA